MFSRPTESLFLRDTVLAVTIWDTLISRISGMNSIGGKRLCSSILHIPRIRLLSTHTSLDQFPRVSIRDDKDRRRPDHVQEDANSHQSQDYPLPRRRCPSIYGGEARRCPAMHERKTSASMTLSRTRRSSTTTQLFVEVGTFLPSSRNLPNRAIFCLAVTTVMPRDSWSSHHLPGLDNFAFEDPKMLENINRNNALAFVASWLNTISKKLKIMLRIFLSVESKGLCWTCCFGV